MPGPILFDPTPQWLQPQNRSVFDSPLERALQTMAHWIGADDPTMQVAAPMMPMETGPSGGIAGALQKIIKAYHGSPHDFEKFDLSKIGTGEGAQAYGHGLYFAEHPETAQSYKDALKWKGSNWDDPQIIAAQAVDGAGGDRMRAADQLKQALAYWEKNPSSNPAQIQSNQRTAEAVRLLLSDVPLPTSPKGKMYEVAIHADPEQFLDWDKPLSQQSEAVQKAARRLASRQSRWKETPIHKLELGEFAEQQWGPQYRAEVMDGKKSIAVFQGGSPEDVAAQIKQWRSTMADEFLAQSGSEFYKNRAAVGKPGSNYVTTGVDQIGASGQLRRAGIPGIKYLDQGSRSAGEGTRNYVVFDDSLIEILRKYGLLPPIAAGAVAGSERQ